jgi:asparagine synthase/glutamine amidotransferase-like protein
LVAAFDGELFLDEGVKGGREAARLLIEAYLEQGDGIDPPQGCFSAALWDPRSRELVLVNDRYGHRPVWTASVDGAFVVAGELKGLIAAGLEPQIDVQGWAEFLAYESALREDPLLEGTRLLPPAVVLIIGTDGEERMHRRWEYRLESEPDADEREFVEEFGRLLDLAVARCLSPDTALALSGGLDSRSVASVLISRAPGLPALTWGGPNSADLEIGARIAAAAGLRHQRRSFEPGYIARRAPQSVWLTEGHSRCFHVHLAYAQTLRETAGARSLLIPMGGDHIVRTLGGPLATGGPQAEPVPFHIWRAGCLDDELIEQVLTRGFADEVRGRARAATLAAVADEEGDSLARIRQLVFKAHVRKVWSQTGLFGDDLAPRDPFDDHDLVEFCRRMPERFRGGLVQNAYLRRFPALAKIPNATGGLAPGLTGRQAKVAVHINRARARLARRLAPNRFIAQQGIGDYAADLRHGKLLEVLVEPRTLERGQLREAGVRRLIDETLALRKRRTRALGVLATFELFQRQFIDGDGEPF